MRAKNNKAFPMLKEGTVTPLPLCPIFDRFDAILLDDLLRIFVLLLPHDPDADRLDHLQRRKGWPGGGKLPVIDPGVGAAQRI